MVTERIRKTEAFIRKELGKLSSFKDNIPRMAEYRIEHSIRVAHIAEEIAEKEGFDRECAFISGLLHDIGYSVDYESKEEYMNHGRVGARLALPFLISLGIDERMVEEICYGIAIHVDDKADFPGERTPFALSVGDADNIDRFDAFRLYESLLDAEYRDLKLPEQIEFLDNRRAKLEKLRTLSCGTETATAMWQEKIDYQLSFISRLKAQTDRSVI